VAGCGDGEQALAFMVALSFCLAGFQEQVTACEDNGSQTGFFGSSGRADGTSTSGFVPLLTLSKSVPPLIAAGSGQRSEHHKIQPGQRVRAESWSLRAVVKRFQRC
jgi:hypothetical protein